MNLTKALTTQMKAFCIIVAVLHNYVHWTNKIGENELALDKKRIYVFLDAFSVDAWGSINYILTYVCWPVLIPFIFISAYGVSLKLEKGNPPFQVVMQSLLKVTLLLLAGTIFLIIGTGTAPETALSYLYLRLSTIPNLTYVTVFDGIGPWWYFSLAIQVYLLLPIVFALTKKWGALRPLIFSYACIVPLYLYLPKFSVFATAIGHLPEMILAAYLVQNGQNVKFIDKKWVLLLCLALHILANFHQTLYPYANLSFMILFLYFFPKCQRIFDNKVIMLIGTVSPFMFVINGPLRAFTMKYTYLFENTPMYQPSIFLMSLMHLFVVIVIAALLHRLVSPLINKTTEGLGKQLASG